MEQEHRHDRQRNLFHVRVEIGAPGKQPATTRTGPNGHAHEDVYVALRDAFNAAVRQLEDHVRERGGRVKAHEAPLHGAIRMIDRDGGFGFIETAWGEVYFHRNSVVGKFEKAHGG